MAEAALKMQGMQSEIPSHVVSRILARGLCSIAMGTMSMPLPLNG